MFKKYKTIPMKGSASFLHNNLSFITDPLEKINIFAVVFKNVVNLTISDDDYNLLSQKQIIPRVGSLSSSSSSSGAVENQVLYNIIQAKFVEIANRVIIVICSTKGVFFYEEDGVNLIYFLNFRNIKPTPTEETAYCRGIAAIKPNTIAIGTSSGTILLLEIPAKGPNVSITNEIINSNSGITDLVYDSENNLLDGATTDGSIFAWSIRSSSHKLAFDVRGNNECCTALGIWKDYLIASYGNGTISLFRSDNGRRCADVSAHARWINSLDIRGNQMVSAGEDCFFRVWELMEVNGLLKVSNIHNEHVQDSNICAAQFSKDSKQILVTSFDNTEILVFKTN